MLVLTGHVLAAAVLDSRSLTCRAFLADLVHSLQTLHLCYSMMSTRALSMSFAGFTLMPWLAANNAGSVIALCADEDGR